jgi:hypothetical protein
MVGEGMVTLGVARVIERRNSHLASDLYHGRRVIDLATDLVKLDWQSALLHHAIELGQEVDVKVGAAKLPIGNGPQTDLLLQLYGLANRIVFRGTQLFCSEGALFEALTCLQQRCGAQQASNVVGPERRHGACCSGSADHELASMFESATPRRGLVGARACTCSRRMTSGLRRAREVASHAQCPMRRVTGHADRFYDQQRRMSLSVICCTDNSISHANHSG